VHRHLPSLAELKNAAQESLDWLWEWYWSQLDSAFGDTQAIDNILVSEDIADVREKLHSLLKTYVKDRKSEIKARKYKGDEQAAESTISTYTLRFAPSSTTIPSARIQAQLLQMLVGEKMVLPAEKKLNSSMAGAFLIWTPLLVGMAMTAPGVLLVKDVLDSLLDAMNSSTVSRTMMDVELDPVREGMAEWIVHILGSQDWQAVRDQWGRRLIDDTLVRCLTEPTVWNLKVVERFLEDGGSENREHWKAVLEAARGGETTTAEQDGEAMDVDIEGILEGLPVKAMEDMVVKEKIKGPQKVFGMWKAKPIGWLPEGWEDDE
jgi:ribosomal biogenesis protein LAS1